MKFHVDIFFVFFFKEDYYVQLSFKPLLVFIERTEKAWTCYPEGENKLENGNVFQLHDGLCF